MRNIIRQLREKHGYSQEELAMRLGVKRSAVSKYENGMLSLTQPILIALCDIFKVSADYILGLECSGEMVKIPLLGTVRGGLPSFATEDISEYEMLPERFCNDSGRYFALEVKGESMSPLYMPDDIVIVRKQQVCSNGKDAIVMVGSDEATIKRFYRREGMVILQPMNPAYSQMVYTAQEVEELPVRIAGVVVEMRRKIE